MKARDLLDIEIELTSLADAFDRDPDIWAGYVDRLRDIARMVGAQGELLKLRERA